MKKLPKISEMEHITSKELGDNLDAILDRVSKEDIALIIDHQDKSYVLCPAHWFEAPGMDHLEMMVKNSVRYAIHNDTDLKETADMVKEFAPSLHRIASVQSSTPSKGVGNSMIMLNGMSWSRFWKELSPTQIRKRRRNRDLLHSGYALWTQECAPLRQPALF